MMIASFFMELTVVFVVERMVAKWLVVTLLSDGKFS